MADQPDFAKLVPGFDFLQKLMGGANAAMPPMGQWVAPTLNPEELEKRINELRTVQFWLEQNARMLGATIQALEVQRMTLTTLKTMNVKMGDLRDALKIRLPDPPAAAPAPAPAPAAAAKPPAAAPAPSASGDKPAAGAVDPMQWWSALTQQFGQLAAQAMQDGAAAAEAARATLASSMAQATAAKKAPEGQGAEAPADTPETSEAPAAKTAARKRSTK
ncbi:PhaM family polyhydroxyalkanoate granule multifunctional regulatory protein [Azohydromonas australica]|uniref:PhaM family polyhydroxyalkanoate granule multifunctional regulatory protein n=1 Tax=Azohydromonas australica TaxID=364039 RepID=UPI00040BE346|nr:PhaM family polyhydroxyalkanoate granule multifunctional regulatory protein [Azohydromonas australica]